MTLRDYNAEEAGVIRNSFPILCALETDGVVFEDLIVDGTRPKTPTSMAAVAERFISIARRTLSSGIASLGTTTAMASRSDHRERPGAKQRIHGHTGYGVHPGPAVRMLE